jgi:hypothetical protein
LPFHRDLSGGANSQRFFFPLIELAYAHGTGSRKLWRWWIGFAPEIDTKNIALASDNL